MTVLERKTHHPYTKTRAQSVVGPAGVVTLAWNFDPRLAADKRFSHDLFVWDGDYYAADLGFHGKVKPEEDWYSVNAECAYTDGPCWYDGTSLGAERVARLYLALGEDALFAELEAIYHERFEDSTPRCDICGRAEGDSPNILPKMRPFEADWNGETGNHASCEVSHVPD
jgi:hypothetical protein